MGGTKDLGCSQDGAWYLLLIRGSPENRDITCGFPRRNARRPVVGPAGAKWSVNTPDGEAGRAGFPRSEQSSRFELVSTILFALLFPPRFPVKPITNGKPEFLGVLLLPSVPGLCAPHLSPDHRTTCSQVRHLDPPDREIPCARGLLPPSGPSQPFPQST